MGRSQKKELPLYDVIRVNPVLQIGISHTDSGDVLNGYAVDYPPEKDRPEPLKPVFTDMMKHMTIIALMTGQEADSIIFQNGMVTSYPSLEPEHRKEILDRMVMPSGPTQMGKWDVIMSVFAKADCPGKTVLDILSSGL